jgi:ribosome maturation factor RimP
MDLGATLEVTVTGLGYELVDVERVGRGLLRVYIDKREGISVEDCALVSNQLTRVLEVEGVAYDRLEVSSPGLDRPLKKAADFVRFRGERARIKLRVPKEGQRNFVGFIGPLVEGSLALDVDGKVVAIDLADVDKAKLAPDLGI